MREALINKCNSKIKSYNSKETQITLLQNRMKGSYVGHAEKVTMNSYIVTTMINTVEL